MAIIAMILGLVLLLGAIVVLRAAMLKPTFDPGTTISLENTPKAIEYGEKLAIAVERGNVFATQFHPEKSGDAGMEILRKFVALGGKS